MQHNGQPVSFLERPKRVPKRAVLIPFLAGKLDLLDGNDAFSASLHIMANIEQDANQPCEQIRVAAQLLAFAPRALQRFLHSVLPVVRRGQLRPANAKQRLPRLPDTRGEFLFFHTAGSLL